MIENFGAGFLAFGPIIIILIGVVATIILASSWQQGAKHWLVLFIGPILTIAAAFGSIYLVTKFINPSEGSGFLLGGAAMGLYFLALSIYYPVLIIYAIVKYVKKRKELPL